MRGGRLVFADLSFALEPGDALVLRGPNGTGKSTLLRLLAGFLAPTAGQVTWSGVPVAVDSAEHRSRLHFVGHADPVKPPLTVAENVGFAAAMGGGPVSCAEGLAAFGLAELAGTPGRFLSSGQRRRTTLARLLATPRLLWLLDEPGVGLDTAHRRRLEDAVATHRARGGMCIVATHGDVSLADPYILDFVA